MYIRRAPATAVSGIPEASETTRTLPVQSDELRYRHDLQPFSPMNFS